MSATFTHLLYHLIFSTKYRLHLINDEIKAPLYEYIGAIVRGEKGTLLAIGGMPDHVHLLVRLAPDCPVSGILRSIKANTSRWANERFRPEGGFRWQRGYGAFSVSESQAPVVRGYIDRQEEHHSRFTLREELATLLNRHGIQYDERFLLE